MRAAERTVTLLCAAMLIAILRAGPATGSARPDGGRSASHAASRDPGLSGGRSDLRLLPILDPAVQVREASSHALDGSNRDWGNYLYRDSQGRYVLMEAAGSGAITRIWMAQQDFHADVSEIGRVEIFIDGETKPRVDLPARDLFSGRIAPFLAPLCGDESVSSGGNYCELPMPFRTGVRVAVTGQPPYFDIGYETYPAGTPVRTFRPYQSSTRRRASDQARLFSHAGADPMIAPAGGRTYGGRATIAPGQRRLVADIRHPGTIRALKVRLTPADDVSLQNVWLQAQWDGQRTPAVAAPLADAFLTGAGARGAARGLLAGYLPGQHLGYLYFPMPFADRAQVALVNHGPRTITARWVLQTSPVVYHGVGSAVGEFHATFTHDRSSRTGSDVDLLNADGEGKIVGVSFTEEGPHDGALPIFMEGDERVYFDSSRSPSIYGTGTEDMFDGGFYYERGAFSLPTHGATTKETTARGDGLTSQYRLLVNDPWPFRAGVRLGLEHGAGDGIPTAIRGVVFWYGNQHSGLRTTDTINVGSRASERKHSYHATGRDPEYPLTAFYEGDHDGDLSSPKYDLGFIVRSNGDPVPGLGSQPPPDRTDPMHELITSAGRRHPPGVVITFRLKIDPNNHGVILRRQLDQAVFGQRAVVTANGARVGIWLTPGANTSKRWADSDFFLPASVTAHTNRLSIELQVLPSLPTRPRPESGWTDFRYTALTIK